MAIRAVKFKRLLSGLLLGVFLAGCAQLERRSTLDPSPPDSLPEGPEEVFEVPEELQEMAPPRLAPKVGVVLGPGLMNTYAHVGTL